MQTPVFSFLCQVGWSTEQLTSTTTVTWQTQHRIELCSVQYSNVQYIVQRCTKSIIPPYFIFFIESQTQLHLGPTAMNGCPHSEQSVTYKGSNTSHWRRRCKICGLVEGGRRDRRDAAVAAAVPVPAPAPCWHFRFHWKGSNQFQFRKLCLDCGKVWTIQRPLEVPEKYKTVTTVTKSGTKKWSSADFKTRVIQSDLHLALALCSSCETADFNFNVFICLHWIALQCDSFLSSPVWRQISTDGIL